MRSLLKRISIVTALLGLGVFLAFVAVAYHPDVPAAELESRYADVDSRFLEIAGSRVHVKDVGPREAPPLLLIHGTSSSLHTWDGWAEELGDRFRIVRLDLPGFGLTGPNRRGADGRGDYSTAYRLEVIDGVLDTLQVNGPVAVAGNSLGGYLAVSYAAASPHRVSAGILINAAGAPRDPGAARQSGGFRAIDLATLPVANQLLVRLTPRFLVRDALRQVYGDPSKVTEALIDRHHDLLLREGNRRALVEAATRRSPSPPAAALELELVMQPMLVMWGRRDAWIPVSDAEIFHGRLPVSELIVYEDAGHVPMEEFPGRSARDAAAFLDKYAAAAEPSSTAEPEAEPGAAEASSAASGDHAVARQEY
ncbi:MAG: alpha/beta hydrolase [Acidobacteriota bacterium]